MSTPDDVRASVSRHYEKALSRSGSGSGTATGCCGGGSSCGTASSLAGYRPEDVDGLPGDAVENSFGCGNPLAFGDVREGDVVLDLGSGAGIDLLIAARKVGPGGRVIGVDMTDDMVERARRNVAAAGLSNVEVRKGLIEALPVETASVDHVISNCVINLSPEKERVFAEIARVLKPGGRMRVSDIVAEDLPDWLKAMPDAYSACVSGAISEAEYQEGLRRAGLEAVEVEERLVYDADQVASIIADEVPGVEQALACCGAASTLLDSAARTVAGRVWSAKFTARKPLAAGTPA